MANTTWDRLDKSPTVALSGDDLVATFDAISADCGIRCVDGKVAGKFYAEVAITGYIGGNINVAVQTRQPSWADANTSDLRGAYCYAGFNIYFNGSDTGLSVGGWAAGDTIGVALDLDNAKVWFRKNGGLWNGNAGHDPETNSGGIDLSSIAGHPWFLYAGANPTSESVFSANFGDAAFDDPAPSGFIAGWPDNEAVQGAALSPAYTTAGLTLTNDNRTASAAGPVTDALTRTALAFLSGKTYVEWFLNGMTESVAVGTCESAATAATLFDGQATGGAMLYVLPPALGRIAVDGSIEESFGCPPQGATIGFAIDADAGLYWTRINDGDWNNDGTADPATGTGGFDISSLGPALHPVAAFDTGVTAAVVSLNTSSFGKLATPSGFTAGLIVPPSEVTAAQTMPAFGQVARGGVAIIFDTDPDALALGGPIILVEIDAWRS